MRGWGIGLVALASVVAASCDGGVEFGKAPTTTAAVTTTLPPPAPTTTTSASARKATAKTTTKAAPQPTLPPPEEHIEIKPEHIRPFLVDHVSTWFWVPDDHARKGPLDIDGAAADAAGDDQEAAAAIRDLLERLDFLAGYSRRWDRADNTHRHTVSTVSVALLLFSTQEAGKAYLDFRADIYDDVDGLEEMYVDEAPRAQGWIGGNEDDGYGAVIICEYEGFFFEIVAENETSINEEYRRASKEFLVAQHKRLRSALE